MDYKAYYSKRQGNFNPLTYNGNHFYEDLGRTLPPSAFLPKEDPIQEKNKTDPYVEDVFKLRNLLPISYYDCKVPRDISVENPLDQYNLGYWDTLNGKPIKDPKYYENQTVQTRLSIFHLINLHRHMIPFEFLRPEDLRGFYQELVKFLDYYHNVLSVSLTYVYVSLSVIQSLERLVEQLRNQFSTVIDPRENGLPNFSDNPLMNNALQKHYLERNPEAIEQPVVVKVQTYQAPVSNVTVSKVSLETVYQGKVERVQEADALPNIFHDNINVSKIKL